VQFGESASGAATVQGTMVGADQARAGFGGRQNAMESREQTLMNGKRRIRRIAIALKISDHVAESAGEWFRLALTNNFVQGRRSQNVLAACLYVSCRREKTHHMLIDFSSALQISVFSLGATFLKMVKALHITKLPLADPSLFIQHFAEKLDFKDKNAKVVRDAVKLAQRMASDWIHEGRRPAGIAGACVLLAARMNNFRRSHSEIVAVAHVAEETIQRRLNEFKNTKSGALTISDFRVSENLESSNPPSFEKNRVLEARIQKQLEERNKKLRKLKNSLDTSPVESEEKVSKTTKKSKKKSQSKEEEKEEILRMILSDCDLSEDTINTELTRIINRKKGSLEDSLYTTPHEKENITDIERQIELDRPRNLVANNPKTNELLETINSNVELNSDDDDEEILSIKLTPSEVELKERIWTGLNHDFIIAQEKKRLKQEADELAGNTSATTRKKRKTADSDFNKKLREFGVTDMDEPSTAAESASQMMAKKSFSKKINYSAFNNFLDGSNPGF
jgi:transcription factor IIIB subunit 2